MNIPTRLLILQRLQALLGLIEYEFNGDTMRLQGAVFIGRNLLGEESKPWPAISITEAPASDLPFFGGSENVASNSSWTLLVQGIVEADTEADPTVPAYYLYAEVEKQLFKLMAQNRQSGKATYPNDYRLGNLITDIEISPPVVRQADDKSSAVAFFFLPIRVGIATILGQPYTAVP